MAAYGNEREMYAVGQSGTVYQNITAIVAAFVYERIVRLEENAVGFFTADINKEFTYALAV